MIRIPIRITVMGLFLLIATIIMAVTFYIQVGFSKDLAKSAMKKHFEITSYKIEENIKRINAVSNSLITSTIPFIKDINAETLFTNKRKYLEIFSNILNDSRNLYSVYIGFNDNRFYELIKLDSNKDLKKIYNAKKEDKWLLIEINKYQEKILSLYDKNFKLSFTKNESTDYIVNQRPWYKKSIESNTITKVGPYTFSNISENGITYSKNMNNNNVFAIDILLENFSDILKNNSHLESYLFDVDQNIIAKSSKEDLIFMELIKNIDINNFERNFINTSTIKGKEYIYSLVEIKGYNKKEYLLSYVLLDLMMTPYMEKFSKMDKILIVLFFIFIPILWFFASIIVKPILLLAKESNKIKNREFNKVITINSSVKEISLLSSSLSKMANSLYEYQLELEQMVTVRTKELEHKNKELEILSITDKLTNTYNRIKLDNTIEDEMLKANKENGTFSIIIIDIDYFKKVNDTYGHLVGDVTLVEFTKILKSALEDGHILGRWGGEEFVIISSIKTLDEIIILANKLREKIQNHNFPTIGSKTASFGVSLYKKEETSESLINRADEALFIAKKKGRNRVETLEK